MSRFSPGRLSALVQLLFRRNAVESDLEEEVASFYQTLVEDYRAKGMEEDEARRLARLKFGLPEQAKEEIRAARTGALIAFSLRDAHYALRSLRRSRTFATVTVVTLALGIAANATIFSMISRFILKSPPVANPQKLLSVHLTHDGERCCNNFSWLTYRSFQRGVRSFSDAAAYYSVLPASIGGSGDAQRIWGEAATTNFFDVSQTGMTLGRGFARDEDDAAVVVIGYRLWRRKFGADPSIVQKRILLSGRSFEVIGVAPAGFHGLDLILDSEFWIPLGQIDQLAPNTSNRSSRSHHWLNVIARLKSDTSQTQAAAELLVFAQRMAAAYPDSDRGQGFLLQQAGSLPPRDRSMILVFLTALTIVGLLVLAIACANVANLFLAQTAGRAREMAVRIALGATLRHLLQQILAESFLLGFAGAVCGMGLSLWTTRALGTFHFPAPVPLDLRLSVDWRVLLYSFLLSTVAGLLFGLVPFWTIVRPLLAKGLRGDDLLARPGQIWTLGNLLVVSQIAMSLVLLSSTGLFLRSLRNAAAIETGFRSHGLLLLSVDPRLHGYSAQRTNRFLDELRERVSTLPGVVSASYTDSMPLTGGHRSEGFRVEGQTPERETHNSVDLYMAGPDYFETIGTGRLAGRGFHRENPAGPKMAVVNQAFVRRFLPGENALGQRVTGGGRTYQIIGVVKNIKSRFLGEEFRPVLYRSLAQDIADDPSSTGYSLLVRYAQNSAGLAEQVRKEIRVLDPSLAVFNVRRVEDHLEDAYFLPRLASAIFGAFGFLGVVLAGVGLYGVMDFWVRRRTREIGIRLALGATVRSVQHLIVREGMILTAAAFAPGLAGAWALARLFSGVLYGVQPHDPTVFILVPCLLAIVAVFACWLPSRQASRAEPLNALRHE